MTSQPNRWLECVTNIYVWALPAAYAESISIALFWWSALILPTDNITNRYTFPVSVVVLFEP